MRRASSTHFKAVTRTRGATLWLVPCVCARRFYIDLRPARRQVEKRLVALRQLCGLSASERPASASSCCRRCLSCKKRASVGCVNTRQGRTHKRLLAGGTHPRNVGVAGSASPFAVGSDDGDDLVAFCTAQERLIVRICASSRRSLRPTGALHCSRRSSSYLHLFNGSAAVRGAPTARSFPRSSLFPPHHRPVD